MLGVLDGELTGEAVQIDPHGGGRRRGDSSGEQTADHTAQDIAGSGFGQGRRAGGIHELGPIGQGDDGMGPLQHHDAPRLLRPLAGKHMAGRLHLGRLDSRQTGHFPGMGGQDRFPAPGLQRTGMFRQDVQPVGVQYQRKGHAFQHVPEPIPFAGKAAQPGTYGRCGKAVDPFR